MTMVPLHKKKFLVAVQAANSSYQSGLALKIISEHENLTDVNYLGSEVDVKCAVYAIVIATIFSFSSCHVSCKQAWQLNQDLRTRALSSKNHGNSSRS